MINHETHFTQSTYFLLADFIFKFYMVVHGIEKMTPFNIWRELCDQLLCR